MAEWRETYRAVVFPWHCDHFGHMNVRWYAHHFDDAGFHLWTVAGIPQSKLRAAGVSMVVARNQLDFKRELVAGELFYIQSAFVHLGNRSLSHLGRMYNADTHVLCATQLSVEVFFDPETRKSAPMPDGVRRVVAANLILPEG